jgi:hypothetical protein
MFLLQGAGKVHHETGNKSPKREQKYESTISLTSALEGVDVKHQVSAHLTLGKRQGNHCTGRRVGPKAGLDW